MTISGKRSGVLAAMVLAMLIPASGCQLVPEIFNEDIFLSAIDMESGTQNQARPEDENLIRLNFNNRLEHTVVLTVLVHRPSRIETVKWTLYGRSTVGQFLTNCQNDPPSLIRLQFLGEDQSVELPEEMFFPDAYVFVNGVPTLISKAPPPLQLDRDYVCGDSVEFIIRTKPEDAKKFEILAAVYRAKN
ncbi:MAG: hypothetical protein GXY33_20015 [Phycisphaerae bacterium]|nr:hypothetical protein [Phycisphaerae bacterium]